MNGELTERERAILDMWPRFEDGEPVMVGDESTNNKNQRFTVKRIEFRHGKWMLNDSVTEGHYLNGKSGRRVMRPAPKVLDADGVEIKMGDTVWHEDGSELHVIGFGDVQDGETMLAVEYAAGPTKWGEVRCLSVTHTRPAPKVLDADGVEIHLGDTVYEPDGQSGIVIAVHPSTRCVDMRQGHHVSCCMDTSRLTHACPDSWERLEEDAVKVVCEYAGAVPDEFGDYDCDTCRLFDARGNLICEQLMARDIVRRAKAIAGVEVDG